MDSADVAAVVVDEEQRIISVNPAFRALVARDDVEPIGVTLGEVIRCINVVVEDAACGKTSRCLYCALHQAFQDSMREHCRVGPFQLHRTVLADVRPSERVFELCVRTLADEHEGAALITLKERDTGEGAGGQEVEVLG